MLTISVLAGFIGAMIAPLVTRFLKERAGWVVALLPAGVFAYLLLQSLQVCAGQAITQTLPWAPSLGLALSFRLDGLGLLFALLISGIGALVAVYAGSYLAGRADIGRFYVYHLSFMASMLGVVLSDNLIALFVFWELTSVTSYLLIGFDHTRPEARAGALKALLITGGGGLAMLAGFILLGQAAGSYEISAFNKQTFNVERLTVGLILLGAFTKSAQWPFHIWLPDAMQAPTPVSAYLHSATMVKAGVYLLARLLPIVGQVDNLSYVVVGIGLITMLVGGLLALKQTDLKAILAYTTISWLGALVMLLGWGNHYAVEAAMVGVLAHALYKGALFLLAGGIDHAAGTRDIRRLGELHHAMPLSALLASAAAFSMAGVPLLFGFVAKELFLEAALHSDWPVWLGVGAAALASLLNVAIALRLFHGVFFARAPQPLEAHIHPHDPPLAMLVGPAVLGMASLVLGIGPGLVNSLIAQAASAALGESVKVKLALWHGVTPPLMLSLAAILAGSGLYLIYDRAAGVISHLARFSFNRLYDNALAALFDIAGVVTRTLQNGTFRYYLMTILATCTLLVGGVFVAYGGDVIARSNLQLAPPRPYEILLAIVIIVMALMVTQAKGRLAAIAGMSVIGALVSLFFVLFSAPDLALTQLVIETLMVIVFLLVFHFLPRFFEESTSRLARARDAAISTLVGLVAAALVLFAAAAHFQAGGIAEYFIQNSYRLAHGRNVVNVILVDFRGFDTLGEISVLTIAATGIYALLKGKR